MSAVVTSLWGAFHIERPVALFLAVPWLVFWWWFAGIQRRAFRVVWERVDPRAQTAITVFDPARLGRHLAGILVLGLILVVAAARPTVDGETQARPLAGRVALLIDASASMYATDVAGTTGEPGQRFEAARRIAQNLVAILDDYAFAVVSWSGEATLQVPMTSDRASLEEALRVVEVHNLYRRSGSHFGNALDRTVHFAAEERDDLQAVILSDGEQPTDADYAAPLAALAERGVAVHGVAIGSEAGQARQIYDFRDVIAGKQERRILRAYTTRRVDSELQAIADATGGSFLVAGPDSALALARAIRQRHADSTAERTEGRRLLAPWLLALFAAGFGWLAVTTRRPPTPPMPTFDLTRLGSSPPARPRPTSSRAHLALVLLALVLLITGISCRGDDPAALAARENARGNAADALGQHDTARIHYERSIAFGQHAEIPTFNLARSLTRQGAFSEAHDVYQRAIDLAPRMAPAYFNDGWALFLWGDAERDPRDCDLERTLALWQAARDRFASAASIAGSPDERARARANLRALAGGIAELERSIAEPPPHCQSPSGGDGGGGGGGSGGGGSGGAGDAGGSDGGSDPPPGDDQSPAADDDGRGGGPAPLSGDERQQVARALERIRAEAAAEGTYHRRSLAEQFPAESWQSPDPEISW